MCDGSRPENAWFRVNKGGRAGQAQERAYIRREGFSVVSSLRSQLSDPALTFGLALMIIIASTPSLIGLTIVPAAGGPTISVDICHPLHTCDLSTGAVHLGPLRAFKSLEATFKSRRSLDVEDPTVVSRLNEGPDPPPPKLPD
jgi:hypothetical protein